MPGMKDIQALRSKADAALWSGSGLWREVMRLITAIARDMKEADLSLRAAGLVYTTLLSLAPMLALIFSVLKGFGVHNMLEPFLEGLLEPLGEKSVEIAGRIVGFVANVQVGVLGTVGFLALLYGVISLMGKIEAAFNVIWRVEKSRPLAIKMRDYLCFILIGPVLMFVSVALSAATRYAHDLLGTDAAAATVVIGQIVSWLLFAVAFSALYLFMPYTRVRPVPALAAGMLAAGAWKGLGWLFGMFVAASTNYAAVYSAFAALLLFMIWLQAGWQVVLAGASASYYLQNPSNRRLSRKNRSFSAAAREKLALQLCADVGANFYAGDAPLDAARLSTALSLPLLAVEEALDELVQAGILARTGARREELIPGCPFDTVSVEEMLSRLRSASGKGAVVFDDVPASAAVSTCLSALETAHHDVLSVTLKSLATGTKQP